MADTGNTFVTGTTGSGKSLYAIQKIRDYLNEGRRVVTNLDINLDVMMSRNSTATITRVPDQPRSGDMLDIGFGYDRKKGDKLDKSQYGLIVLDECSTWMNRRAWNDKDRLKLIQWFVQIRKYRWNSIFLAQGLQVLDEQIVKQLLHYHVNCRNLETIPIPFMQHFGLKFPTASIASRTSGTGQGAIKAGTETYQGKDLFEAYDTEQAFTDDIEIINGKVVDMRAIYTVLSSKYLHQAKQEPEQDPEPTFWDMIMGYDRQRERAKRPIHPEVLTMVQALHNHVPRTHAYQTIWGR